jgi:hypothetical protein
MRVIWYVHLPGEVYANSVGDYPKDFKNEKEVRQHMREWLGVKRLPRGTGIWKSNPWW